MKAQFSASSRVFRLIQGRYGDAVGALRLSRELLSDYERVLGPDDSDTLTIRNNIAHWAQMLAEKAAGTAPVSEGDSEQGAS